MGGDLLKAYLEYAEAACQCTAEIQEDLRLLEEAEKQMSLGL
jgi:hypothetical protein